MVSKVCKLFLAGLVWFFCTFMKGMIDSAPNSILTLTLTLMKYFVKATFLIESSDVEKHLE